MKRTITILLAAAIAISCTDKGPYYFNGPISEEVLNNYLSRAITLSEFLTVNPYCVDGEYSDKEGDINYILNTGTKFVGRAIYRWGNEQVLNEPGFWDGARNLVERVHEKDPDVIFQCAVFEAVYPTVCQVHIPAWTFEALGLPVEDRNFRFADMLFSDGLYNHLWGEGGVPDIRQVETQLWLMYLIGSYIQIGCEAVHLGQVYLMGANDHIEGREWENWYSFITKVRRYATKYARRHWILFDCHGGRKGVVYNGTSIIDYNAYPLRIKQVEGEPMKGILEMGYSDSIYGADISCTTPSGWHTDALPYLVEFDNYGATSSPGEYSEDGYHIWGYDEICWLYLMSREEKCEWLDYAYEWLKANDPAGHLQMPGARVINMGEGKPVFMSRAVAPSELVPYGMDIEEKVKELFERN